MESSTTSLRAWLSARKKIETRFVVIQTPRSTNFLAAKFGERCSRREHRSYAERRGCRKKTYERVLWRTRSVL